MKLFEKSVKCERQIAKPHPQNDPMINVFPYENQGIMAYLPTLTPTRPPMFTLDRSGQFLVAHSLKAYCKQKSRIQQNSLNNDLNEV